jgi:hypothetical protein
MDICAHLNNSCGKFKEFFFCICLYQEQSRLLLPIFLGEFMRPKERKGEGASEDEKWGRKTSEKLQLSQRIQSS